MSPTRLLYCVVTVCSILVSGDCRSAAAQDTRTPSEWIAAFTEQWDERQWEPEQRKYMRPLDDEGWKIRMRTMHGLVSAGESAIDPLVDALQADDEPTRILAAQTLGYLAPDVPTQSLLAQLKQETSPPVQLYLVDSLGMQGRQNLADVLNPIREKFDNRDVRKHISYAIERGDEGLPPGSRRTFVAWKPESIDTAHVGGPAPDFELASVNGGQIRLSDFRGKKAVILVFIYGDT